ncbi:MAG TPA: serine/threonine-protein kinase [Lacipirellula sp.]
MADSDPDLAGAVTIEAPRRRLRRLKESDQLAQSARRRVALVEGSTPHLSSETRSLLRKRLRMAALLLGAGFGLFFLWLIIQGAATGDWIIAAPFYAVHVGVALLLGFLATRLCSKCDLSLTKLRVFEAMIFGAPAAYFFLLHYDRLQVTSSPDGSHPHVPQIVGLWMLLVFTYALFVPNNWRRAGVVIGLMATAPVALNLWTYLRNDAFAQLVDTDFHGVLTEQALIMTMSALGAIVGVHTIGALRREAFVAKQLGQYRLKKLLGSGGMGEVYLAEHQMMKRPCAVKVIRAEKAGDPQVLARFEREVRATAKLSHWNTIDIYDYGRTEDGTFYYVMEFLPGHNVGELVKNGGPLPANRILYLMRQICDALAEAHNHGLVHRDLKPANLYVAYRGGMHDVAKVLDFGLAKPLHDATSAGLTQEGSITGSPLYMSPEQASSEEVDARSDVYSLGAVMYYMATGKAPFAYENPMKVMIAHATEDPEPPRYINGDVPAELEEIILRAMEKRPADRFQSMAELRDALDQVPVDSEWTSRTAADWWSCNGCPERKALCAQAIEMAAV